MKAGRRAALARVMCAGSAIVPIAGALAARGSTPSPSSTPSPNSTPSTSSTSAGLPRFDTLLGFDTEAGKAFCLDGVEGRTGVAIQSVGDDGWTFGRVHDPGEENPSAPAAVQLSASQPVVKAYLGNLRPPAAVFAGLGFVLPNAPRDPDVAVYPRKSFKGGGS